MLLVPTELRSSSVHGIGLFSRTPLKKGDLIWQFDSRIDRVYSQAEIDSLPQVTRDFLKIYCYLHKAAGLWVLCGDNARHFNHSENPNILSVGDGFAGDVAAIDIPAGTELTGDYRTFCDHTVETGEL